jgi:hypothetical protein
MEVLNLVHDFNDLLPIVAVSPWGYFDREGIQMSPVEALFLCRDQSSYLFNNLIDIPINSPGGDLEMISWFSRCNLAAVQEHDHHGQETFNFYHATPDKGVLISISLSCTFDRCLLRGEDFSQRR